MKVNRKNTKHPKRERLQGVGLPGVAPTLFKHQRTLKCSKGSAIEKSFNNSLRLASCTTKSPVQVSVKKILRRIKQSCLNKSFWSCQVIKTKCEPEKTKAYAPEDCVTTVPSPKRDDEDKENNSIEGQRNVLEEESVEKVYKKMLPLGDPSKRPVIIDGSDVGFRHSQYEIFSVQGIKLAIDYFKAIGHNVKCIVPSYRTLPNQSSDPELLQKLHKSGDVTYTPCKKLQANTIASCVDRFILQIASDYDAAVVSNNQFRDLIDESTEFKILIETRVITFMFCADLFILAKEPYGKKGPRLEEILNLQKDS